MIEIKSRREIEIMRDAGRIVAQVLESLKEYVKPGVTTLKLDRVATEIIEKKKPARLSRDTGDTPPRSVPR